MNFYYSRHLSLLYREGLDAHDLEPFEIAPGDMVTFNQGICYSNSPLNEKITGIVFCTGMPHTALDARLTVESDFGPDVRNQIIGVIWAGIVE
jgi:hypothetical protein